MTATNWRSMSAVLAVAGSLFATAPLHADVKLHKLFSDNALLQRGEKTAVFGTADKPDAITVKFGDQTVTASYSDGKWKAELKGLKADAAGKDLVVTQGNVSVTLKNVVVGDVWICGGQSNMQWDVNGAEGKDEAIAAAANPAIRLFTVNRRGNPTPESALQDGNPGWVEAKGDTIGGFTAVGYYFGRELQKNLKVPIGLISSNIGGTTAERWMSKESIDLNDEIKDMHPTQGRNDLYNAMIAPLAGYGVKGAVWYQGESNADRPYNYRHVMAAMIQSWRDTLGNPDMPFIQVELAPFTAIVTEPVDQDWAVVRESQQWVAHHLKNVDTVSIVDIGDDKDIHPKRKRQVGERLATAARALAYGEKITPAGPEFGNAEFSGDKAVIKFNNLGKGLEAKGGELTGFTIAGEDKKFYNATAKIVGDTVVVTSDKVALPKAVRLGWASYPVVNLWNKDGYPASPFRTDDWEVVKQAAK
jgi:sialate O-acetylesterase